jgi:RNA polymerase sigma factor (sigma-70 family)
MIDDINREGDEALLKGLLREDPRVLRHFYEQLQRRVRRYFGSRYKGRDLNILDECFSTAFQTLLEKLRQGEYKQGNLNAYAFTIVKFTFFDARRKAYRGPELTSLEVLSDMADETFPPIRTAGDLFDDVAEEGLLDWYLALSRRDQEIMDMRAQGFSHDEIAGRMGLNCGSVRNIFQRLIRQAREVVMC